MGYDADYYREVYHNFDDPVFARRWALGCALTGGYAGRRWAAALEFGAGLGQNLAVIDAGEKWAVDVNDASRRACEALGATWKADLAEVPDGRFDLVLSRHSLEHVDRPRDVLAGLAAKARPGGRLFLVVPLETLEVPRRLDAYDEHRHLYAWTPTTIKNLCLAAGWRPQSIALRSCRGFNRMLPLVERHPGLFLALRGLTERVMPPSGGEMVVLCSPAADQRHRDETTAG